jgi:hypothetical protein
MKFFHDEACTITANQTGFIQNVESYAKCQRTCQLTSTCNFFLYEFDIRDCQVDNINFEKYLVLCFNI